jgi:hypothetical protein
MSLTLDSRVRANKDVFAREFDGEIVLIDLGRGEYYGLDGVGRDAWQELSAGRTVREVAASLVERYEVDESRAQSDVIQLIQDLLDHGLVEES